MTRERRILFLNRTLTRDISEILGKRIEDFVTPSQREATIECVERAFRSSGPADLDLTVTLASGNTLHLSTRFIPFESPSGQALALQITKDVTERRRLTEELEQSMEFRRKVIENLPDFVAVVDPIDQQAVSAATSAGEYSRFARAGASLSMSGD